MPKRRQRDCDDEGGDDDGGRNCYTRQVNSDKLDKSQEKLQCLIDTKAGLEENLEKCLIQIEVIAAKIRELECKVEKLVSEFGAKECVDRMKQEILMIKDDRTKAEQAVNKYKAKIMTKTKKLEQCKKTFGSNGSNAECD